MAVTKKWTESVFRRGESAQDVYWVDATNENDACNAAGIPQQNTSHLLDPRLLVQGAPEVKTLVPAKLYELRIYFVRLSGGEQKKTDDPLDKAPIYRWEIGSTSEPVDADADGNPLVNSVGDSFEGCSDEFPTLFLTYTRNEGGYDIQKALAFGNKTNDGVFLLNTDVGPLLVQDEQCLCRSITAEPYAADAEYVTVNYSFEFREDSFERRIKDEGFNGYYNASGTPKKGFFADANGDRLSAKVALRNGKPIDTNIKIGKDQKTPITSDTPDHKSPPDGALIDDFETASFLKYRRKKSIDFAGLNL